VIFCTCVVQESSIINRSFIIINMYLCAPVVAQSFLEDQNGRKNVKNL
jgi:hypothetical protein